MNWGLRTRGKKLTAEERDNTAPRMITTVDFCPLAVI